VKSWLAKTSDGKFNIQKLECPHGGAVDLSKPPAGVLHTTEGSYESALSVFRHHYAPTFLVGDRRISQLVPLGSMAEALENPAGGVETNRWARVQIEVAGFSQEEPYVFPAGTMDALSSLLATLKIEAGIPLSRPYPDKMPAKPWATPSFRRRHDGKWGNVEGWYGHVEVPENGHWDPGALKWSTLLKQSQAKLPKKPSKPKTSGYWLVTKTFYDGHQGPAEKVKSVRLWALKQGNLVKKGVRHIDWNWVETG
jgi:hypothetical protein